MIQFGNDKIKEIYVGSDKIKEVYHGGDLVWTSEFDGIVFSANNKMVEWKISSTSDTGLMDINQSMLKLDTRNVQSTGGVASIETVNHYDISNFTKLILKWKGARNNEGWSGVAVRFIREGIANSNTAPGWYRTNNTDPMNWDEDLTIAFNELDYKDNWGDGVKYKILIYVWGAVSNTWAWAEISEIQLL